MQLQLDTQFIASNCKHIVNLHAASQAYKRSDKVPRARSALGRGPLRHSIVESLGSQLHGEPQIIRQWRTNRCYAANTDPVDSLQQQPLEADVVDSLQQQPLQPASSPTAKPAGDVLLELRDVHKSFGNKRILQGATLQVRRGQAIGIIGGSGTGKSTTLRLLAGLLAPDKGHVIVQGVPRRGLASDDTAVGKGMQIGMVFQSGALFDSLTVGENVGFLLYEHSKLAPSRVQELVARSLAAVGLSGVEALMPSELSGGMKKRVALARAIIRDDEFDTSEQIIMYDEPTAGLDPVASTVVEDLIRSLQQTEDSTRIGGISSYIVVTHQYSTILRAVDSLIFLHEGSVVWTGTVQEFETTDVPIVTQFRTGSLKGPIKYE